MVAAFDYCLHGKGGAAPSIDTAMHGLVDAAHVDHLHPDSGIAIATAADGEQLTEQDLRRQGGVGAVAAAGIPAGLGHRRDQGRRTRRRSAASSVVTASPRGVTRRRRPRPTRCGSSTPPPPTSPSTRRRSRSARPWTATPRCPRRSGAPRRPPWPRPCGRSPRRMRRWSVTSPTTNGCWSSSAFDRASPSRGAGHLLPGPLPADQGEAAGAGPARRRQRGGLDRPAEGAARGVPGRLPGLLRPQRRRRLTGDPRGRPGDHPGPRGGDVLVRQEQADRPGGRGVLPERDQRDARRRGPVHVRPDRRGGEVPDRVLGAGGGEAGAAAEAEAAGRPDRPGHRRGVGHRQGHRHPAGGRGCVCGDRRSRRREGRRPPPPSSGTPTWPSGSRRT